MDQMRLGMITSVKTGESGTIIDILGYDGAFYEGVELLNSMGNNEVPAPSDIPKRDASSDITGASPLPPMALMANVAIKTVVMYTVVGTTDRAIQQIIPIKFFKNYSQGIGSPPKGMLRPQPGEVAYQASGNKDSAGGFLYLNKLGDMSLGSANTCSLEFVEATGKATFDASKLSFNVLPYTIEIADGSMTIAKQIYTPGSANPINDVVIQIDPLGNITIAHNPAGLPPVLIPGFPAYNKITVGVAGISISSTAPVSINSAATVNLGLGIEPTVKGMALLTYLNTHTHGSASGPTTPSVVPATGTLFSTKIFGE